jgi:hypothetical protein
MVEKIEQEIKERVSLKMDTEELFGNCQTEEDDKQID